MLSSFPASTCPLCFCFGMFHHGLFLVAACLDSLPSLSAFKSVTTSCFVGLMIWMFDFKMATCVLNLGLFHLKTVTLPDQHRAKLCVIHVL